MSDLLFKLKTRTLQNVLARFGLLPEAYPEKYEQVWGKLSKIELFWVKMGEEYQVKFHEQLWKLQVNQKTSEPRYTLFIKKEAILSCDILPDNWHLSS